MACQQSHSKCSEHCALSHDDFGDSVANCTVRDVLKTSVGCLTSPVVVCFMALPLGGGEQGSPPHKSSGFVNDDRGYFGGGRVGTVPFLLTMTRASSEGEGQALFLTTAVCTSGEEGQALLFTFPVCTSTSTCWRSRPARKLQQTDVHT